MPLLLITLQFLIRMDYLKRILLFALLGVVSISVKGQNLEEIISAHLEAVGQGSILSMRSLYMEVREIDGFGGGKRYTITKKAPNKIRIEGKWQEHVYINAFDGKRAWTIAPWTGVYKAQLMTEKEMQSLLLQSAFGSPLDLPKEGDNSLKLIGLETIQGDTYHVVRYSFLSGYFVDYLLNKETNLIYLIRTYTEKDAQIVASEVIFKNYKDLGGFKIPFGYEKRNGRSGSDIIIDDIILGYGVANSFFNMPVD
jgi:hypothetical protein